MSMRNGYTLAVQLLVACAARQAAFLAVCDDTATIETLEKYHTALNVLCTKAHDIGRDCGINVNVLKLRNALLHVAYHDNESFKRNPAGENRHSDDLDPNARAWEIV